MDRFCCGEASGDLVQTVGTELDVCDVSMAHFILNGSHTPWVGFDIASPFSLATKRPNDHHGLPCKVRNAMVATSPGI